MAFLSMLIIKEEFEVVPANQVVCTETGGNGLNVMATRSTYLFSPTLGPICSCFFFFEWTHL